MAGEGTDGMVAAWLMKRFVCCGYTSDVLACLQDALRALTVEDWTEQRAAMDAFKEKHFRSDGAYLTYLHYLSERNIEEHGGCSPGWATDQGKRVLEFLDEHGTDDQQWPAFGDAAERLH